MIQETIEAEAAISPIPADRVKVDVQNVDFFYGKSQALFGVNMGIANKAVTALARREVVREISTQD